MSFPTNTKGQGLKNLRYYNNDQHVPFPNKPKIYSTLRERKVRDNANTEYLESEPGDLDALTRILESYCKDKYSEPDVEAGAGGW
jgi:hypothetical protein